MLDPGVSAFIHASVRSVWALEVLLLLRRTHDRLWTAAAVAAELRANERLVTDVLHALEADALVRCDEAGCVYAPAVPALAQLCDRLDAAYRETPVAVVKAIMASPKDNLQIFANAFRFRSDS